jgi:hypothetical protein
MLIRNLAQILSQDQLQRSGDPYFQLVFQQFLQALRYTLPIRIVAKAHIAQDCPKESYLLCEAGFLFRMLEDTKGIDCQASNFSRAFSSSSQGASIWAS